MCSVFPTNVFTHFSTDETMCEVSISGLQCLEGDRNFCTCGNCMEISDELGETWNDVS